MHLGSSIDLCDSGIHSIPIWLSEREGIRILHMSNNDITGLPRHSNSYSGMRWIDLKNNPLREPVSWINLCASIEVLDLGRSFSDPMVPIPAISFDAIRFDLLVHLRVLSLNNHDLRTVPASICKSASLETLDLSFNAIEEIPPQIQTMPALRDLNVAFNFLKEVRTPQQLELLCVAYNPIVLSLQLIFCRAKHVCANGIPVDSLYANGITKRLVLSAHLSPPKPPLSGVMRDKHSFEAHCIENAGYSRRNCLVRMKFHIDEINLLWKRRIGSMPVHLPTTLRTEHYF